MKQKVSWAVNLKIIFPQTYLTEVPGDVLYMNTFILSFQGLAQGSVVRAATPSVNECFKKNNCTNFHPMWSEFLAQNLILISSSTFSQICL